MLTNVKIKNFKSIRDLEFSPRRVNVFVGEPNTGKSNILEALAFFSVGTFATAQGMQEILRFKTTADLFFDQKVANAISIDVGDWAMTLNFGDGNYRGVFLRKANATSQVAKAQFMMSHVGLGSGGLSVSGISIRHYVFKALTAFPNGQPGVLNPPFGDNLVAVLYTNEALRQRAGALIRQAGFRLQLKPADNELLIAKDVNDELYSYPWTSVSETLRRAVFLMAVLETNNDATLLLDEPESNTFPFYTKYFAERIALDSSNQYFLTTHNPYLLSSVVEKTPVEALNVFVTTLEGFETKLKRVPDQKLQDLLDLDSAAFFNLPRLVEE
jgi:hypothetical protein